jgi:4-amino-4-deoxy-L-arabinose transferase-like glycosyltransferase
MPLEIQKFKISRNPFILFSPFLVLFIILAVILPTNGKSGDEIKYLGLAQNLLNGFFSTPPPDINLGNGPGYPILLMPFVAFHLPLISITIANAVLYYFSIILVFKILGRITTFRKSVVIASLWGCYFNLAKWVPVIYTEVFVTFLITLLVFCIMKVFDDKDNKRRKIYVALSGFTIGYMALTKPVFGYVLLCMLAGSILLLIFKRRSFNYRNGVLILLIAFLTTLPYLVYTYSLTGRTLYWGSAGGNNLYWMSTPEEDEYGSWTSFPPDSIADGVLYPGGKELFILHHQKNFEIIDKYTGVEQDDMYKKIALDNIKAHPVKFIKNCFYNAGRILFNYPYTYTPQKPTTLLWLPFNGILVILSLFCAFPTVINWAKIGYPIKFMLFFILIYLGGSVLGSAENRMFNIAVPVLLPWLTFVLQKTIRFKLKID